MHWDAILKKYPFKIEQTDSNSFLCDMRNSQAKREEYRSLGKGYYHFCTDGQQGALIFNNECQYAFGMLMLGLVSVKFGIRIYAFTIMPNHVHIILGGTGEDCLSVFDFLKRKLSLRLVRDGYAPLPDEYWFKLVPIETDDQMRTEIVYVLRNCLEDGLAMVGGYPWSSSWLYHSPVSKMVGGVPAGQISGREMARLLLGRETLPQDYLVHTVIGLHPASFVDMSLVLRLFPEPKDLQTALVKDYELYFQIARRLGEIQKFNKTEILSIVSQTLQKHFSGRELRYLSEEDKGKMVIILSRDFGLNSYQISTSIFVKEKTVRQLLSSKELK